MSHILLDLRLVTLYLFNYFWSYISPQLVNLALFNSVLAHVWYLNQQVSVKTISWECFHYRKYVLFRNINWSIISLQNSVTSISCLFIICSMAKDILYRILEPFKKNKSQILSNVWTVLTKLNLLHKVDYKKRSMQTIKRLLGQCCSQPLSDDSTSQASVLSLYA